MSKTFIVGAAGTVGRRLVHRLAERGHDMRALHRRPEQAQDLVALVAEPVAGSLTNLSVDDLARLMRGCGTVVFSAGEGGAGIEVTNAIDGRGLETTVAAARKAGVPRCLLVSAFPDAGRGGARAARPAPR